MKKFLGIPLGSNGGLSIGTNSGLHAERDDVEKWAANHLAKNPNVTKVVIFEAMAEAAYAAKPIVVTNYDVPSITVNPDLSLGDTEGTEAALVAA